MELDEPALVDPAPVDEDVEPVELPVPAVVPLRVPIPPPLVVSSRTWSLALSQHLLGVPAALEEVEEVEVWATATPAPPARIAAAAINAILVIAVPSAGGGAVLCPAVTWERAVPQSVPVQFLLVRGLPHTSELFLIGSASPAMGYFYNAQ